MDEDDIRKRITDLRIKKGVSEYQMSLDLGQSKGYIQNITSGRSLPSMHQFLNICSYFNMTPLEFFDYEASMPVKAKALIENLNTLSDKDFEMISYFIKRLSNNQM